MKQIFSTDFQKVHKYPISWKSIQWSQIVPCRQTQTWWI